MADVGDLAGKFRRRLRSCYGCLTYMVTALSGLDAVPAVITTATGSSDALPAGTTTSAMSNPVQPYGTAPA